MKFTWFFHREFYTKDECAKIIQDVESHPTDRFTDTPAEGKKVGVTMAEVKKLTSINEFMTFIETVNEDVFGFDLFPNTPKSVNLNRYIPNNGEYPFHLDGSGLGSTRDVKLTALINLSQEPYEGGDLILFYGGKEVVMEELSTPGSVLIFPSFIYHRVSPVSSGERITLSMWLSGPNWR